ncbi:hypothetical protein FACS1894217_02210 [Clostridia bacterium]|nr:hypothetical protein FACS1894217_02210 [Clostridia bacterium]
MSVMEQKVNSELRRMSRFGVRRFLSYHVHIVACNLRTTEAEVYTAMFSLAQRGALRPMRGGKTMFEYNKRYVG